MWKKILFCSSCILSLSNSNIFGSISPDKALHQLMEGNQRFAEGRSSHKKWEQEARKNKSESQSPFAVILGCSDSRSPPELIFDQDLGDLFVVRVAGNVVGEIELASIEFAVAHLHSSIVIVLGHQECGAVKTAITESSQLSELHAIYPLITTSIAECRSKQGRDKLTDAIYCNIKGSVQALKASPVLRSLLEKNKLKIVGGFYDFHSGKVNFISESKTPRRQMRVD